MRSYSVMVSGVVKTVHYRIFRQICIGRSQEIMPRMQQELQVVLNMNLQE